jgi:hypothetical protein
MVEERSVAGFGQPLQESECLSAKRYLLASSETLVFLPRMETFCQAGDSDSDHVGEEKNHSMEPVSCERFAKQAENVLSRKMY